MPKPLRPLVKSKQSIIVAGAVMAAGVGMYGAISDREGFVLGSVVLLLAGVVIVAADIHRKVGHALAVVRSDGVALSRSLADVNAITKRLEPRLESLDNARQGVVSELSSLRSQLITRLDVLTKDLLNSAKRLSSAADSTGTSAEELRHVVEEESARLSKIVDQVRIRDSAELQTSLIVEMDALLQIHGRIGIDRPTPLMGGWAMSPVGMKTLIDLVEDRAVKTIVECGSGTSTVLMAMAIRRLGREDVRIVSLEHLVDFADFTKIQLTRLGLDELVEIRYAPLEPVSIDGAEYSWYAETSYQDLSAIDLVVVDGPPKSVGHMARFPAYPLLRDSLADRARIVADDSHRPDERTMVAKWLRDDRLHKGFALNRGQVVLEYRTS